MLSGMGCVTVMLDMIGRTLPASSGKRFSGNHPFAATMILRARIEP